MLARLSLLRKGPRVTSRRPSTLPERIARIEAKLASLANRNDAKSVRLRELLSAEWDALKTQLRSRRISKRHT